MTQQEHWLKIVPAIEPVSGLTLVLDPSEEFGRWPKHSARGVVQIDKDSGRAYLVMPHQHMHGFVTNLVPTEARIDLENDHTFGFALRWIRCGVESETPPNWWKGWSEDPERWFDWPGILTRWTLGQTTNEDRIAVAKAMLLVKST